jgi:FkbM family methyltransferase
VLDQGTPSQGIVVDVGANLGYFSLAAASMGYQVVSFEPLGRNAKKLFMSTVINGKEKQMSLYMNAVGSVGGQSFRISATHSSNQGNGKLHSVYKYSSQYGVDYTDTVALSDVIHSNVLFMKIDVEGYEMMVLDGAQKLLDTRLVHNIVMEVSDDTKTNARCDFVKMLKIMRDRYKYKITDVIIGAPELTFDNLHNWPPNIWLRLENIV